MDKKTILVLQLIAQELQNIRYILQHSCMGQFGYDFPDEELPNIPDNE